jgi:predicted HTH transcriptional regulator
MNESKDRDNYFINFINNPTKANFKHLIQENTGEKSYLDFKGEWLDFAIVAKHVLAFANSGGGCLVLGVEDNKRSPIGLYKSKDETEIRQGIQKYLPNNFIGHWENLIELHDFDYNEGEDSDFNGKKFQALIVRDDYRFIPFLSVKEVKNDKDKSILQVDTVYIRRGTSSCPANDEELQKLINRRIEAGYSSKHLLDLSEHLEQLKILYREKEDCMNITARMPRGIRSNFGFNGFFDREYSDFIDQLIEQKRLIIERCLSL